MRLGYLHGVIFITGLVLTVTSMEVLTSNTPLISQNGNLNWSDLAKSSLNSSNSKKRNVIPTIGSSRKPSSDSSELIIKNEKGRFIIQGQIINIEKKSDRPRRNRLAALRLESGKLGYLSGEIVLSTSDIVANRFPLSFDGIEIKLVRMLSKNTYLLSANPATEVLKAQEYLKSQFKIDFLKLDIVDREIKAL
jgi:hypothetical protein